MTEPIEPTPRPRPSPEAARGAVGRRRARIRGIRRSVAVLTTAGFLALFAGLYVQLALGKDPALGTQSGSAQVDSTSQSGSSSSSSSEDSFESDDGYGTEDGGGYYAVPGSSSSGQASSPPAVTTGQS